MITIEKADGGLCGEHYIHLDDQLIGLLYICKKDYPNLHGTIEMYHKRLTVNDLIQIANAANVALENK